MSKQRVGNPKMSNEVNLGQGSVGKLLLKLAEAGCPVQALHQQDESLESYYLDLIGGDKHA